jgi:hypothetical protein
MNWMPIITHAVAFLVGSGGTFVLVRKKPATAVSIANNLASASNAVQGEAKKL